MFMNKLVVTTAAGSIHIYKKTQDYVCVFVICSDQFCYFVYIEFVAITGKGTAVNQPTTHLSSTSMYSTEAGAVHSCYTRGGGGGGPLPSLPATYVAPNMHACRRRVVQ